MAKKGSPGLPAVNIGNKLGAAFDELEERIRERAYHIFLDRGTALGDPVADWLDAQMELVSPIDLEIKEQKKNIVVEAIVEGFSTQEIEIEVVGDTLKIFGSHSESGKPKKRGKAEERVSRSISFYQSVTLPAAVDLDGSHAKLFKNGKLKITLPRVEPLK
jgi:HSP20 family molecular chaperone IbpA